MKGPSAIPILKTRGLRDTQTRRMVLDALQRKKHALSPRTLQQQITAGGGAINTVTIYRVLAALANAGLVHRHPCNGLYSICSLPERGGHHGFLHCEGCGGIEEFCNEQLCQVENRIARTAHFLPSAHVSELIGLCRSCQRS